MDILDCIDETLLLNVEVDVFSDILQNSVNVLSNNVSSKNSTEKVIKSIEQLNCVLNVIKLKNKDISARLEKVFDFVARLEKKGD